MPIIKRLHAIVSGNVQGVGFRYFVQKTALKSGLAGWVRNLSNGDVELEAEGEQPKLDDFLATIRTGHPWAQVSDVAITRLEGSKKYDDFEISI